MARLKRNRRQGTPKAEAHATSPAVSPSAAAARSSLPTFSLPTAINKEYFIKSLASLKNIDKESFWKGLNSLKHTDKKSFWKGLILLVCVGLAMVVATRPTPVTALTENSVVDTVTAPAGKIVVSTVKDVSTVKSGGSIRKSDTSDKNTKNCAKHNGFIIANMNGRMANNLFQIAMAHRLSEDLCWPIIFKEQWQGVFPHDTRCLKCFPRALQGDHVRQPNSTITQQDIDWFKAMKIAEQTSEHWPDNNLQTFYKLLPHREHDEWYQKWRRPSSQDGTAITIASLYQYDFVERWDSILVEKLRNPADQTFVTHLSKPIIRNYDTVRTIHLAGFYIRYDWMEPWMDKIRNEWLVMNKECCHHIPPENAVVVHARDFKKDEGLNPDFQNSVYMELLDKMYFQNNEKTYVLWIVCQPGDEGIDLIKTLQAKYSATIVTGDDPLDAFCTIREARQLVVATHSTFSQMAALLSPHQGEQHQVHYLFATKKHPPVTLVVPEWRYHLVNEQTKASIQEYDVDIRTIEPIMS